MASDNSFVQAVIPRFDGHYDHWSMLMENFLRSKEYWQVVESGLPEIGDEAALTNAQKNIKRSFEVKGFEGKKLPLSSHRSSNLGDYSLQRLLQADLGLYEKKVYGKCKGKACATADTSNRIRNFTNENRYGHYKSECRTKLHHDRGQKSNYVEEKEEDISLLMACHKEEKMHGSMWYLDTDCNNHMCGDKSLFLDLDESFRSTIKFGDNSTVSIIGKGNVKIYTKDTKHCIGNVYFAPDLKTNLLSVGQLQEKGFEVNIKDGIVKLKKLRGKLNVIEEGLHG
ncbi:hypothetical protein KIW84_057525 [Lathyrus oleraceus]|uniref:Retrovirus-related Pol polyprotein from transposon TNT 1-94-like beta-barrel domain-containing protein n=1 Tax=Pisum sativum TaxID=3888 RepID=A0A9D4X659_PEA|nr:hypothetical protein KIW84_057525 [Pisum sativum]